MFDATQSRFQVSGDEGHDPDKEEFDCALVGLLVFGLTIKEELLGSGSILHNVLYVMFSGWINRQRNTCHSTSRRDGGI